MTITDQPTVTSRLWMDDNGQITCEQHAGSYLLGAISAQPDRAWHCTPLGTWALLTSRDIVELRTCITRRNLCERCPR